MRPKESMQDHAVRTSTIMICDAFAHLPIYGLEDLGFVPRGEAGAFIAAHNTASGGNLKLPLNTNSGGLSHMHFRHVRPPRKSPAPGSRSATMSVASSPPLAPSSCRTRRPRPRCISGIPKLAILT
jgi:hypothetical protein